MKGFVFWVLVSVAGTALVFLSSSTHGRISSVFPDIGLTRPEEDIAAMTGSRKLKEIAHGSSTNKSEAGSVHLEDCAPIDPVPNSTASIRPGPIQHGAPLMPYIPKPYPPPEHPKDDHEACLEEKDTCRKVASDHWFCSENCQEDPWSNNCRNATYCNLWQISTPGNVSAPHECT